MEAVGKEARSVVVQAEMKRRSFRGVVDVVYGGEKPQREPERPTKGKQEKGKRKAEVLNESGTAKDDATPKPISKREQKRQAKKARLDTATALNNGPKEALNSSIISPKEARQKDVPNGKEVLTSQPNIESLPSKEVQCGA